MSKFLHDNDAKAVAVPWVFSEKKRAEKEPANCHKDYICKVSSYLVKWIRRKRYK